MTCLRDHQPRVRSGTAGTPAFRQTASAVMAGALVLGGLSTREAVAYDLPPVNLGYTSFYDGGVPAGTGFYFNNYTQIYNANTFKDDKGRNLALPAQKIDYIGNYWQLFWVTPWRVGDIGNLSFDAVAVTIPGVHVNDGLGGAALTSQAGLGNVFFGPAIQFDPIMGEAGPVFLQRLEFTVIAPAGAYERTVAVNPASSFWSLDPYYAFTYFITPQWSFSSRQHYLYNFRSDRPSASLGPEARTSQAGQAYHANFDLSYALSPAFSLGMNAYFLQQLTNTKVNGFEAPGRKERVFGVGPGIVYALDKDNYLFVNSYFESFARNRTEGQSYVVRYVGHF